MKQLDLLVYIHLLILLTSETLAAKKSGKPAVLSNLTDPKDLKKLLRTKTNVLICFYTSIKESQNILNLLEDVARHIKGEGVIVAINCSGDAKKLCKKVKISGKESFVLKHYKDGEFHKDYDRKYNEKSIINFMRDPTGDIPWEDDDSAKDVVHIPDPNTLRKILRKERRPLLLLFYAPWCGYCKALKPEYAQAATDLKDHSVLAAVDVNRAENSILRNKFNITGFPTLLYFQNGTVKYTYEGENRKASIVSFMHKPSAPQLKLPELEWSEKDTEVIHLSSSNFEAVLKDEPSVLVMFYAPWCGHCKRMKPEYEKAAVKMKNEGIRGILTAVDATKEHAISSKFNIKGYPTVTYFSYGKKVFDVNIREASKIVEFMRDPAEPPPPPPVEIPWHEEVSDVVHLTNESFKPFLKKKKHVLIMFYAPWCGHCKKAKPEFQQAATHFKDDSRVEFGAVDCTSQPALCSAFDVKGYPTIKYFSYYNKETRLYNGGRTEQDFIQFMSNPMSTTNQLADQHQRDQHWIVDSSILQLNEKNFHGELRKAGIVLVMFYAPWCGHCKRVKPEYTAVAKELEKEGFKNTLAVVDCSENPNLAEQFGIRGFPTIKLFKNGKYISDYDGKRTSTDIKQFMLRQHKYSKDEL